MPHLLTNTSNRMILLLLIVINLLNLNCMLTQHTISIPTKSALRLLNGATKIKLDKIILDKKDESVSDRFCRWLYMPFIETTALRSERLHRFCRGLYMPFVRIVALMIIGWFIKQIFIDFFLQLPKYSRTVMVLQSGCTIITVRL